MNDDQLLEKIATALEASDACTFSGYARRALATIRDEYDLTPRGVKITPDEIVPGMRIRIVAPDSRGEVTILERIAKTGDYVTATPKGDAPAPTIYKLQDPDETFIFPTEEDALVEMSDDHGRWTAQRKGDVWLVTGRDEPVSSDELRDEYGDFKTIRPYDSIAGR